VLVRALSLIILTAACRPHSGRSSIGGGAEGGVACGEAVLDRERRKAYGVLPLVVLLPTVFSVVSVLLSSDASVFFSFTAYFRALRGGAGVVRRSEGTNSAAVVIFASCHWVLPAYFSLSLLILVRVRFVRRWPLCQREKKHAENILGSAGGEGDPKEPRVWNIGVFKLDLVLWRHAFGDGERGCVLRLIT